MAIKIFDVYGDVSLRDGGLNQKLGSLGRKLDTLGQKFTQVGRTLSTRVTLPLVAVGTLLVKLGSDAEEVRAKFETAFRDVRDQADETARNLADNYGLSQTAAERLLSSTGDLLKGFGATGSEALGLSERVQQLAVDLASYNNVQGGSSRASEILTKAMLGERDALTSLGIKISEAGVQQRLLETGQENLTGRALLLAKAQATLELAYQQSGDALGDFARTQDSFANQLRQTKADAEDAATSFRQALLPAATALLQPIRSLLQWVTDLDDRTKRIIVTVAGVVAALGPLALAIGGIMRVAATLKTAILGVRTALLALSAPPTGAIVLAVAAATALTAAIVALIRRKREYERIVYASANAVRELSQAELEERRIALEKLRDNVQDKIREAIERRTEAEEHLQEAQERSYRNEAERSRIVGDAEQHYEAMNNIVMRHGEELSDISGQIANVDRAMVENVKQLEAEQEAFDESTTSAGEFTAELDALAAGADGTGDALVYLTDAALAQADALRQLKEIGPDAMAAVERYLAWLEEIRELGKEIQGEKTRDALALLKGEDIEEAIALGEAYVEEMRRQAAEIEADSEASAAALRAIKEGNAEELTAIGWQYIWDTIAQNLHITDQAQDHADAMRAIKEAEVEDMIALGEAYVEAQREQAKAIRDMWVDQIVDLGGAFSAFYQARIDQIEGEYESEEQAAEATLRLRQKQARMEKAVGLFRVTIDTARAIIGFLADPGGLAGAALSIAAAITGGLQAAAIASQPIPQFAAGGVVPGTQYTGDNVVSRLNSGEMVLTTQMQKNLLSILASKQPRFATGADFVVPPGYPHDSYTFGAQSGERVQVTPAHAAGGSRKMTLVINGREFDGYVTEQIENRQIRVAAGAVV